MSLQYRVASQKVKTICGLLTALGVSVVVIADDHMPNPCESNAASCFATEWVNPTQTTIDNCVNYTVCPSSIACLPVQGSGQNAGTTTKTEYIACVDYVGGTKLPNGTCTGGGSSGTNSSTSVLVSVTRCQGSCVGLGCGEQ